MPQPKPARVLLVEDTPSLSTVYMEYLRNAGMAPSLAETGREALAALTEGGFQAMLLDLKLPDMSGVEILKRVADDEIPLAIVVITANGSINAAVEAMRLGAYDFIVKPFNEERLVTTARNAIEHVHLTRMVDEFRDSFGRERYQGFIGSSLAMQAIYRTIESVAPSKATVFITGESGTGKEVCAQAIHRGSPRRNRPFVPLNCGAIPKDLMESEIFGHLKGAFTGAIGDRDGAAVQAHGGTLFLDEICEMDLALQTKLLRFLQTGTIQRVGSAKPEKVDVRIICATNRNPMTEVEKGRFREDLYYRLHVVPIHLPPLREREEDVLEIATFFLRQFAEEEGKGFEGFSADAREALLLRVWPGNVRELQNVIRNAVVLNEGPLLTAGMLPAGIRSDPSPGTSLPGSAPFAAAAPPLHPDTHAPTGAPVGQKLWQIEKQAIEAAVAHCGGSIPKAAKILGLSPSTIYRKKEAWLAEAGVEAGAEEREQA